MQCNKEEKCKSCGHFITTIWYYSRWCI